MVLDSRVYCVFGFSPMSVVPRVMLLEDVRSRELVEVVEGDLDGGRASMPEPTSSP